MNLSIQEFPAITVQHIRQLILAESVGILELGVDICVDLHLTIIVLVSSLDH
jgi:hypothetical protein